MKNQKKTFLNYINVFRGLAILLIVYSHATGFDVLSRNLACIIWNEIVRDGTVLFVFISGFLFQHLSYKFEYKNYLTKKVKNVIMPYLWTSIPGIAFCLILHKGTYSDLNPFVQIFIYVTTGMCNEPTWFIPMIVLFFISSPVLLSLEKKNLLYKFLPVFFIITILVTRVYYDFGQIENAGCRYIMQLFSLLVSYIHFFSIYVFGMFCSANKDIIVKFYNKRQLLFSAALIVGAISVFLNYNYNFINFSMAKIFFTMLILGYLNKYDTFILSHSYLNKPLDILAKYSFGLFFIHYYILYLLNEFSPINNYLESLFNNKYIGIFIAGNIRFVLGFGISMLILYFIKTILLKIDKNINTRQFIGV